MGKPPALTGLKNEQEQEDSDDYDGDEGL